MSRADSQRHFSPGFLRSYALFGSTEQRQRIFIAVRSDSPFRSYALFQEYSDSERALALLFPTAWFQPKDLTYLVLILPYCKRDFSARLFTDQIKDS